MSRAHTQEALELKAARHATLRFCREAVELMSGAIREVIDRRKLRERSRLVDEKLTVYSRGIVVVDVIALTRVCTDIGSPETGVPLRMFDREAVLHAVWHHEIGIHCRRKRYRRRARGSGARKHGWQHDGGIFERVVERLLVKDERHASHSKFARYDIEIVTDAGAKYCIETPWAIGQTETWREVVSIGLEYGLARQTEATGFYNRHVVRREERH